MSQMVSVFNLKSDDSRVCNFTRQTVDAGVTESIHTHEFIKIMRVTDGKADWAVNDTFHTLNVGDIIILNSNEPRRLIKVYYPGPFRMEWIQFTPMTVYPDLACTAIFYKRPEGFTNVITAADNHFGDINLYFSQIARNADNNALMREEAVISNLKSLLIEVTRCYSTMLNTPWLTDEFVSIRSFKIISDALLYIREHYMEDLNEAGIAQKYSISSSNFSRMFKAYYGVGFRHYLRRLRLEHTLSMLWEGSERPNVLDAALSCGFNSASGFYKALHAITGSGSVTEILKKQGRNI